jgi:hypothetical protein
MSIVNFSRKIGDRLSNPEGEAVEVCPNTGSRSCAAFVPALRDRHRRREERREHGASDDHLRHSISNRHIPRLETYLTYLKSTKLAFLIATKRMFCSALAAPRLA